MTDINHKLHTIAVNSRFSLLVATLIACSIFLVRTLITGPEVTVESSSTEIIFGINASSSATNGMIHDHAVTTAGADRINHCVSIAQESLVRSSKVQQLGIPPLLAEEWKRYGALRRLCREYHGSTNSLTKTGCRYVVVSDAEEVGLGNRLAGLASAVAFGIATGRVVLLDNRRNLGNLLCEPFSDSWLLPPSATDIYDNVMRTARSVGWYTQDQRRREELASGHVDAVKVRLWDEPPDSELEFFNEATYAALQQGVKWVVWESDLYTVPNLFLVPSFWRKMQTLIRGVEGDAFRLLTSLALMPANHVWAVVMKEYATYMADAEARVGVQIRLHGRQDRAAYDGTAYDMLMSCLVNVSGYLPQPLQPQIQNADEQLARQYARRIMDSRVHQPRQPTVDVAVLVASLQGRYFERLKSGYSQGVGAAQGKLVRVHTVSGLLQQDFSQRQAELALAEMWLLSTATHLATSASSTFGYAAQSWGRVPPLILHFPKLGAGTTASDDQFCHVGHATDPCSHLPRPPPGFDVHSASFEGGHLRWLAAHLRSCQDRPTAAWQLVHASVAPSFAPPVFGQRSMSS